MCNYMFFNREIFQVGFIVSSAGVDWNFVVAMVSFLRFHKSTAGI